MKKRYLLNNKGQTLVMFILFLPILLLIIGFITDTSMLMYEEKKLNSMNKMVLNYVLKNKENYEEKKVKELIIKNDKNIKIMKLKKEDKYIKLEMQKKQNSMFGNVIGIKNYTITSNYTLDIEEEKIKKED